MFTVALFKKSSYGIILYPSTEKYMKKMWYLKCDGMPLILLKKKNFVFYDHLHGNGGYYAK
jgi:hypothetical protein